MERRVAQHHIQRLRRLPGQAVVGADSDFPLAQCGLPVLQRRLHGHVRLVDQGVLRLRVGEGAGNGQHTIAATQVRDSGVAEVFGQVWQERPGADIQAFAAKHVGVVEQLKAWRIELIAGRVGRDKWRLRLEGGNQQPGLFLRQRCLHRADILLQQIAGSPWQVLDHGPGNHLRAGRQLALQADQLLFEQGQGLRHAYQHAVERALPGAAGRHERHCVEGQAVAYQVLFQGQMSQVRIAAAEHRYMRCQADGQGTETVIEHQHPGNCRRGLLGHVLQQILVGSIEGLQGVVGLLGLAKQVEFGEGAGQQGHGVRLWGIDVRARGALYRAVILPCFERVRGCCLRSGRASLQWRLRRLCCSRWF
ncbi:hypothetical protein D3C80_664720 [compost metagenome]